MKRVLYITINGINDKGGGPLAQRRIYDGLKKLVDSKKIELKVISLDDDIQCKLGVDIIKTRIKDMLSRVLGHSNYFYIEWLRNRKLILNFNPDIVVLGTSRLGFIAKYMKKRKIEVISSLENIELDYVDAYFANKKSIKSKIMKMWEKVVVFRDEKNTMAYSNKLIFLTDRDKNRSNEVYKKVCDKKYVLPICIKDKDELSKKTQKRSIIFLGSLDYGSNLDAIMWFLDDVWEKFYYNNSDLELIIAGSNPTEDLINKLKKYNNIQLYRNFTLKKDVVPINSLFIAPIRIGAGMKVKIAEALSMGVMIVGSKEALIGYEEAMNDTSSIKSIYEANIAEEYRKFIDLYLNLPEESLSKICNQNIRLYEKFYSYERSRLQINNLIMG